jgi:serine/threonine protein kinase
MSSPAFTRDVRVLCSGMDHMEFLGEGNYAKVYKDTLANGFVVAKKVFQCKPEDKAFLKTIFATEVEILQRLSGHPHIVDIYDSQPSLVTIDMECIHGPTLHEWWKANEFSSSDVRSTALFTVLKCMVSALTHMKQYNCIHMDIKPDNIMVADGDLSHCKLIDFGRSRFLGYTGRLHDQEWGEDINTVPCGAFCCQPPEVLLILKRHYEHRPVTNSSIGYGVDMYGIGVLMYLLCTEKYPCGCCESERDNIPILLEKISMAPWISNRTLMNYKQLYPMVVGMLERDERKRCTVEDLSSLLR